MEWNQQDWKKTCILYQGFYIYFCASREIITPEVWEAVQLEEKRRKEFMKAHRIKAFSSNIGENPFASKVICGECGEAFGRKKWRPRPGEYRSVWQCNARYREKGVMGCANRHIDESTLEQVFIKSRKESVVGISSRETSGICGERGADV